MIHAVLDLVDGAVWRPVSWCARAIIVAGGPVWPLRWSARASMTTRRALVWLCTLKTAE